MIDAAIKAIEEWAKDGTRVMPEDNPELALTRANGFPVEMEQNGGPPVPRAVMNQLLYELSVFAIAVRDNGLPLPWDQDVDYRHPALTKGSDGVIYESTANSGPATGNSADPTTSTSLWRPH